MNKKPLGEVEPSATLDGSKTTNLGAPMIFATSLPGFKSFLGKARDECADFSHVIAFVSCILLPTVARRSVYSAGRAIRSELRDAANLLRFLGGSRSPAILLAAAQTRLLDDAHQRDQRLHLLLLDSTLHGQQGQCSENTYSCRNTTPRPKKSTRQQKKTQRRSCHCFVFALLLCPDGTRIPFWLPFHTKEYCQIRRWKHQTQADLAAQLITNLPLAPTTPVVVVGDTAFEAKQIRSACAQRNYPWIVPINPERRLAGPKPRPQVLSLTQSLKASDFAKATFRLDRGELAPMARVSPSRSQSSKHQRVYWVHKRMADVLSVGEVVLLFSTKQDPSQRQTTVVQKVLMSNATGHSAEELLRWYALRWGVEQFFKEMKGQLGMCQYPMRDFDRVAGWVTLCVLSFCYLEWRRRELLRKASKQEQAYWQAARAQALRARLRQEVEREELRELLRLAQTPSGRERLNDLLAAGYDDPAHPRGRRKAG
jgi:hypothetical protein